MSSKKEQAIRYQEQCIGHIKDWCPRGHSVKAVCTSRLPSGTRHLRFYASVDGEVYDLTGYFCTILDSRRSKDGDMLTTNDGHGIIYAVAHKIYHDGYAWKIQS